jgi:hypothetical protein
VKELVSDYNEGNKDNKGDLHVTYDPEKVTAERIVEVVRELGFQGTTVTEGAPRGQP